MFDTMGGMDHPYRRDVDEDIDTAAAALTSVEDTLDAVAGALGWSDLAEIAEHVEHLARALYRVQVKIAGAVEHASPARGVTPDNRDAPFRRGKDLLRVRCRISGAEAQRRITTAELVLNKTSLTGQPLPPHHDHLATLFHTTTNAATDIDGSTNIDGATDADGSTNIDGAGGDGASGPAASVGVGAESVQVVLRVLRQAARVATPEALVEVDRVMSYYAATFDPDSLTKVGQVVLAHVDPDGTEPTERDLATRQGIRIGRTWHGLTRLEIWANTLQTETLMTIFDTATNPRTKTTTAADNPDTDNPNTPGTSTGTAGTSAAGPAGAVGGAGGTMGAGSSAKSGPGETGPVNHDTDPGADPAADPAADPGAGGVVDGRTRAQKMLDALVSACQTALRTATLPHIGGLPPQLVITMNATDLIEQLHHHTTTDTNTETTGTAGSNWTTGASWTTGNTGSTGSTGSTGTAGPAGSTGNTEPAGPAGSAGAGSADTASTAGMGPGRTGPPPPGSPPPPGKGPGLAWLPHHGPIPANQIRHLACDARIIPALLGSDADIIDLGRAQRLVSPAMRKALIARDGGCLTPGCTIPATWTEAHHIIPWSQGGQTSITNSVLLCSYHHHQVHNGRLTIRKATPTELTEPTTLHTTHGPYRITTPWT